MKRLLTPFLVVVLALSACGGGDDATQDGDDGVEPGDGTTVVMENIGFEPAELTVEVGETVTWVNNDAGLIHTVTAEDGTFDSGQITENEEFSYTFEEPGTHPYRCDVHPNRMTGTITVTEDGASEAETSTKTTETGGLGY